MNTRFRLKIKINMKIESFARKMNEQEIEPSLSTASNVYDWFMRWWIFLNRTNFPLFLTHSTDLVMLTVNEMKQRNKQEESLNQLIRQFNVWGDDLPHSTLESFRMLNLNQVNEKLNYISRKCCCCLRNKFMKYVCINGIQTYVRHII